MVQLFNVIVIFLPQPVSEGLLAEGAVAFAAVFVGKVPHHQSGMLAVTLRQHPVHFPHLLPVVWGGKTVVVAQAMEVFGAVGIDPQHLRVFFVHPGGARAGRGCQNNADASLPKPVEGFVQPFKIVFAFLRL